MSDERGLPEQASLRYLKLQAKRRRTAGEFPTLHDAQRAIAREHGQPSWAALKWAVAAADGAASGEGHALAHLRWIMGRFSGAGEPGWRAPDEEELREHFTGQFLAGFPPDRLVARITELAPVLREELVIISATPFTARGRLSGHLVVAQTETRPPYRLLAVQERRLGERISDPRTAAPQATAAGPVPDQVPGLAAEVAATLGLVGLALAGANAPAEAWTFTTGWASLERAEPLRADHVFPAFAVTMAVTATAVLRLAADGRLRLDDRANSHLTAIRLADDAVTVRELLSHTAGVTDPAPLVAPPAPALEAGQVVACDGKRGAFGYSLAGYAALGEIIAERTGLAYEEAVSRLVLRPLGMRRSRFPGGRPHRRAPEPPLDGFPAVTGYAVAADDTFTPVDGEVSVFAAAGGLWTTAADLVRFGLGWPSLLPRSLAAQAVRPHAQQPNGAGVGLGWGVNEPAALVGIVGEAPGAGLSLLVSADGQRACSALTNRQTYMEPVNGAVLHLLGGGELPGLPGGREPLH
ncbi:MAG TPA: serine hydrolase [Trebonia sp.]|nr:serine hydrolase [Trebonia sp.]